MPVKQSLRFKRISALTDSLLLGDWDIKNDVLYVNEPYRKILNYGEGEEFKNADMEYLMHRLFSN